MEVMAQGCCAVQQALVKMRGHDPKALLQDLVDQHLRDNKEHAAMQEVMGGTFAQQIICRSVPHRSEKDEEFYQARPSAKLLWGCVAQI